MRRMISTLFVGALAAPVLLLSSTALAQNNPCGAFDFSQGMSCEILVEGGCTAECEPINFVATCEASCTASADVSCTGGCSVDCEAACTLDPGSFDCQADCEASCSDDCDQQCALRDDADDCKSICGGACTSRCHAKCDVVAPSADCTAKCQASCDASCTASANVNCQADCSASISGGCTAQCTEPTGAIFCNGQYVDAEDVDQCIAFLASNFNIEVDVSGRVTCDETGCTGELTANCGICSVGSNSNTPENAALAFGVGLLGVSAAFARRRRSSKKG